jgi:ADP-L-glycero-D-manno-heptose 6-epimerase
VIILTGSKGFIGGAFLSRIQNDEVFTVDMHNSDLILGDSFSQWNEITLVLHQGAISSTTTNDLQSLVEFNVLYSMKLFEKCIEYQIPVKYASSASVYGNPEKQPGPLSLYAASKHIVDLWVLRNIERFKLIQGFRYFNVFGYGENHKLALGQASPVTTFFHQALTLGEIRIFSGSEAFARDFVWVEDVVEIVLSNKCGSGIFDLGTGNATTFTDVAEAVSRRTGAPIVEVPMPSKISESYQPFTKSSYSWEHSFKTIGEFIEECDLDQWGL